MDTTFTLFAVLGFLAVVLALEGIFNLWVSRHGSEAVRIKSRLAALRGDLHTEVSLERIQQNAKKQGLDLLVSRLGPGRALERWISEGGASTTPVELLGWSALLGCAGLVLPVLFGKPMIFGLTSGLILAAIPFWRVSSQRKKRLEKLEHQFPEALDMLGRAMRAGHSFPTAVRMVGDEMAEPMGKDFRMLSDELTYGVPAPDALNNLADRIPMADVRYFVVAVQIQREAGGNLAELLDNISSIVRARLKLLGEVRTLSAEGKLSAKILTALPFGVATLMSVINPGFVEVLWTDPLGIRLTGGAMFMMVVGIIWMQQVIRIRV